MVDARSASRPSSPPRSPLGQQSRRLSKRASKRTAQPAGPSPCWRPPLGGGLGGSETFRGCQRPLRRGYSVYENRPDGSDATCETDLPQADLVAAIRFFANAAARQGRGMLSRKRRAAPEFSCHLGGRTTAVVGLGVLMMARNTSRVRAASAAICLHLLTPTRGQHAARARRR